MPATRNLSTILVQTLEQAGDGVVLIDSDMRVLLFNQAAEQLWGIPRASIIGHEAKALLPAELREQLDQYGSGDHTLPIERPDGQRRWTNMSISRIEADGEVLYTAFIKDITVQHQQTEQLRLLSLVVDQTDNAILITDAEWRIVYSNSGFTRLFGYAAEQALGSSPAAVVAPYLQPTALEALHAQLLAGQP